MNNFLRKQGRLMAEDVALSTIAQDVGTPVYVYSAAAFTKHYTAFFAAAQDIDHLIAYSVNWTNFSNFG